MIDISIILITIILILIIVILSFIVKKQVQNQIKKDEKFQAYHNKQIKCLEKNCYNTPLSNPKCYMTTFSPCPSKNGSFMQCTNNFRHKVNIGNCFNNSYYYSPKNEQLSEKCVYKSVFPFKINKTKYNPYKPSVFQRINIWRNKNLNNDFFLNF